MTWQAAYRAPVVDSPGSTILNRVLEDGPNSGVSSVRQSWGPIIPVAQTLAWAQGWSSVTDGSPRPAFGSRYNRCMGSVAGGATLYPDDCDAWLEADLVAHSAANNPHQGLCVPMGPHPSHTTGPHPSHPTGPHPPHQHTPFRLSLSLPPPSYGRYNLSVQHDVSVGSATLVDMVRLT
jgi:hypothetical protein